MSLIEQALKKAQAQRASSAAAPAPPAPVRAADVPAPAPPPRSTEDVDAAARNRAAAEAAALRPTKVVEIDRTALGAAGLLATEEQAQVLARQYRAIKRSLVADAFTSREAGMAPPWLIAMASALPGDGKTFTVLNLALSMALERDCKTLLVDADFARPQLSRALGLEREDGLLDLLRQPGRSVESVILSTSIPHLSVMPAGHWSETASEFLVSDRMREVVNALASREKRCLVLFDSPPVLVTSEARVLASLAGQVLLVVKAGVTPQQAVKDTVEMITASNHRLSVILNRVEASGPLSYIYRYGYGYGHEEQYGVKETGAAATDGSPPR